MLTAPGFSYGYSNLMLNNNADIKASAHTTRSPSNKGLDGVYEVDGSVVSSEPTYLRIAEFIPPANPVTPIEGSNRIPVCTLYISTEFSSQEFLNVQ
jgi:hypothetical protein